tara:strand:+ start:2909 stop:3169 length:261 start_codon:yes stop_codon:yes gene_type:complete
MPSDKELQYLKMIEKLKKQIKADKSKVGFGNTPGERKAITGRAEKIKPKTAREPKLFDRELRKPLTPLRPLRPKPFREQRPKKPKA